jgi:hypothetical protein
MQRAVMPLYKARTVDHYGRIRDVFVHAADPSEARKKAQVVDSRGVELLVVTKLREARTGEDRAGDASQQSRGFERALGIKPVCEDLPEVRLARPRFGHLMGRW